MGSDAKDNGQRCSPRASRLANSVGEGWSRLAGVLEPKPSLACGVAAAGLLASENAAGQDCGWREEAPRANNVNGRSYVRLCMCLYARLQLQGRGSKTNLRK